MTNSTLPIGYLRQLRFYLGKPPNIKAYIGWMGAERAAYLLMRQESVTCFITEAVEERFRRAGVATRLVQFAQERCPDLTAEILLTNGASIKLHEAAGFRPCGGDGRIAVYRYRRQR